MWRDQRDAAPALSEPSLLAISLLVPKPTATSATATQKGQLGAGHPSRHGQAPPTTEQA